MYRNWTVRTYHAIRRHKATINCAADAEKMALQLINNHQLYGGRWVEIELLRAAGYGIHMIYKAYNGNVMLERIRNQVNDLDKFHR